ncbi:hypothetical protein [Sorangium sp. So ce1153]|uniref:hypothetical protein n=1 Tax=Sorangium sp. So ce1153 TaxID=3133333 RepID=UPI003F62CE55
MICTGHEAPTPEHLLVISVDDTAAPREDTDAACGNGYDDDEDGLADCADPECQRLPLCALTSIVGSMVPSWSQSAKTTSPITTAAALSVVVTVSLVVTWTRRSAGGSLRLQPRGTAGASLRTLDPRRRHQGALALPR